MYDLEIGLALVKSERQAATQTNQDESEEFRRSCEASTREGLIPKLEQSSIVWIQEVLDDRLLYRLCRVIQPCVSGQVRNLTSGAVTQA